MKIDKITICNLTSIEGEQTIDFTQEPLRSAGLFAITGNTGAGKSTILDAICLALYNEAPRLGNRENVGRNSEEDTPNVYNTCNMLRRGATQGYSHVTFSLNDGSQYIAKWTVALTRNNTFKPLQRELVQLQPRHTTLASGSKDVQAMIKQILKLDYNQFTRTVILAQNSFTNFIAAKRADKSQLLEKITGTEIYASISKQIYQEFKDAEKEATGAAQHMEGLSNGTLVVEDLQRAKEDLNLRKGLQTKYANEQQRVDKQLEWYEEYDKAIADLEEKKKQQYEAQQACNAMYDQQRELERYDRLQPFSATYLNIRSSESDIARLKEELTAKEVAADKLKETVESCEAKTREAKSVLLTAQQTYKSRQSDIKRGLEISGKLTGAKEGLKNTQDDLVRHDDETNQRQENRNSKEAELRDCQKRYAELELARQTMIQHQMMINQLELVRTRLQRMNEVRLEMQITEAALEDSNHQLAHHKNQMQTLEENAHKLQATIQRLQAELLIHEQANKGLNSGNIQIRLNKLVSQDLRSGNAIILWERITKMFEEISNKTDEVRRRTNANAHKEKEIIALKAKIEVLVDTYEDSHRNYTLSQSKNILNLRQELKEGTPCPVCGATHHPFHSDSELQLDELLENFNEQHQQALENLETARKQLVELEKLYNDEQGKLQVEGYLLERLRNEQAENIDNWAQYADFDESFSQCDENVNAHNRRVMLNQIHENVSAERKEVEQLLVDFNKHQDEINRINADIKDIQLQINGNHQLHAEAEAACHVEENKINGYQRTIENSKYLIGEEGMRIEPYMTISDWRERWRSSYEAFDRELVAIKTKWFEVNDNLQEEGKNRFRLQEELRSLDKNLGDLNIARQGILARVNVYQQEVGNYEENLRTMFGASTPEDENQRLNHAVDEATEDLRIAEDKYHTAKHQLDSAMGEIQNLKHLHDDKEKDCQALRTKLDIDISRFNAGEDSTLQYFELEKYFTNSQAWTSVRNKINALHDNLKAISFKVDAADQVVLKLEQSQFRPSETDPEDLKVALVSKKEDLVQQIKENEELLHAIAYKIQAHKESEAKMKAFESTLQKAQQNYEHWNKLNKILGSADGHTFREIAQCYTFEFLVDFANQQLQDLTSRYQLRTHPGTLQLEVIDRHMLDQVRAVNSLSGGESFIVSLSLALGLSSLSSNNLEIGSLFIDEGFGNLDNNNLNMVIDALSNLQNTQRRKVGVISHTEQIQSRISPKIQLTPQPGGRSTIKVI